MKLKGFTKFREKIPILQGKGLLFLPLFVFLTLSLIILSIFFIYRLPDQTEPWSVILPLLGIISLEFFGLLLVLQLWLWKDKLIELNPKKAYQRMIFIGFTGIITTMYLAFNNLIPIRWFERNLSEKTPFSYFFQPVTRFLGENWQFLDILRFIIGFSIFFLGILTMLRSLLTFGFDYMALIYLYYPEESEVQDHNIYSILRHPAYTGVVLVSLAGVFLHLALYHLLYFLFYTGIFCLHIFFVEEKELINRFGDSYRTYQKSVPALIVQPKHWKKFLQYVFGKDISKVDF